MQPGVLRGYRRYRIHNASYPAILKSPGDEVKGTLLLDISSQEVSLLDEFEV